MPQDPEVVAWREAVARELRAAGIAVIEVASAEPPEQGGTVWISLGPQAVADTVALVRAWSPRVALLDEMDPDSEDSGFILYAVADTWLEVICRVRDDEGDDPRADVEAEAAQWSQRLLERVGEGTVELEHGSDQGLRDAIVGELLAERPDASHDLQVLVQGYDRVSLIKRRLRDLHTRDFRDQAQAYADAIRAAGKMPAHANKTVLRDVVYAYMQVRDPGCASKQAVESIVLALAAELARPS